MDDISIVYTRNLNGGFIFYRKEVIFTCDVLNVIMLYIHIIKKINKSGTEIKRNYACRKCKYVFETVEQIIKTDKED